MGIYLTLYLRPISLQLEARSEPHLEDTDGSVTPAERPWQGHATPPGTLLQTFAFIKVDLGPCYLFVPRNRLLHCLYVQMAGHKNSDIISERRYLCRRPESGIPRRAGIAFSSLSLRSSPAGPNARSRKPPSASRSPAPLLAGCGTSC